MWYYERDGTSVGPVEQIEIERMAVSGAISRSTRVWTDGMQDWVEAQYTELDRFIGDSPPAVPARSTTMPGAAPVVKRRGYPGFRNPKRLTSSVKFFLYLNVVVALVAVISGILELQFLTDYRDGLYPTEEAAEAAGLSSDMRQGVIGLFQVAVYLVLAVLVLRWIHRANYNARELGAVGMNFTPGWSIGWYFIPFANFWKPYQAMSEIWRASKSPAAWEEETHSRLLPVWWTLWLLAGFLGNTTFRMSMRAEELSDIISASRVTLASDFMDIPLTLALIFVVNGIYNMQMAHVQGAD